MAIFRRFLPLAAMVALATVLLPRLADGEEACGCWGSNGVYVQYKAPATGWYNTTSDKYIYQRNVTIFDGEIQYLLEYRSRSKYWALFERRVKGIHPRGETLLLSNREVKKIIISCPTRCSCRNIFVEVKECWVINGNYTRSDLLKKQHSTSDLNKRNLEPIPSAWRSSPSNYLGKQGNVDVNVSEANVTHHKLTDRSSPKDEIKSMTILEQSNCLLNKLAHCIDNKDNVNSQSSDIQEKSIEKDSCQQYVKVLSNVTQQDSGMHSPEEYVLETKKKDYILTQDKEGNFWWIVAQDQVYAVSDEAGPCPDQLPFGSKWILVDDSQRDSKIKVVCLDRDT